MSMSRISSRFLRRVIAIGSTLFSMACAVAPTRAATSAQPRPETTPAAATDPSSCFPIEQLPAAERALAERVLLEFSDREGLYTLGGGLKPISSDVRDLQLRIAPSVDTARLADLDRLRVVAQALHCGELGMFVQVFTATYTGRDSSTVRSASMVVYHRQSVRAAIVRHAAFFATLGVTPNTDPREVVGAVENAPQADRWRGYGYLFGYPDDAVDFFVRAGVEGAQTKQLVPRDFRRVETFTKYPERQGGPPVNSSFVYAVPKGADESEGDRRLREAAAPLYARYLPLRAAFIRADSTGAVALWRAWYARP
jgi:hypothetical protein